MSGARILHVHSTFDLGGKEARTVQIMNNFGSRFEHTVVVGEYNSLGARKAIGPQTKVRFSGKKAPPILGKPSIRRYYHLAKYMRQFDLILTYSWGAMDVAMTHWLFSSWMRLPRLIHQEDGFNEDETKKLLPKRNWFRWIALRGCHKVIVPSRTLEEIALSEWGVPERKLIRISNGIDVKSYQSGPRPDAIPGIIKRDSEIIVGTVAGLRTVKNLARLVRVIAATDSNVRLVIVGEGSARSKITAEAKRVGVYDRLVMPGFLEEPWRFIGLFDIFALSSDSEQFPIALIEAMAANRPVVATDVGDTRHMVAQSNKDYIVPKDDEELFAAAIRELASNKLLREKIGADNGCVAEEKYQETSMLTRYKSLYEEAMTDPN